MRETDDNGDILCRFCWWCQKPTDGSWGHCKISQNPEDDRVDLDVAECSYGEMCRDSEIYERGRW